MTTPGLRADARANLERVARAAVRVFSQEGPDASLTAVAEEAGVGIGTVYRRFETKDALIAEVVRRLMHDVAAAAQRHLDDRDGRGLENYLREVCALFATNGGSVVLLESTAVGDELGDRLHELQQALVEQAKRAGRVREDLEGVDITIALWSVHGTLRATRGVAPQAWRRHLELLMLGFRATAPGSTEQ